MDKECAGGSRLLQSSTTAKKRPFFLFFKFPSNFGTGPPRWPVSGMASVEDPAGEPSTPSPTKARAARVSSKKIMGDSATEMNSRSVLCFSGSASASHLGNVWHYLTVRR